MFAGVDVEHITGRWWWPIGRVVTRIVRSASSRRTASRTIRSSCWRSSSVARGSTLWV